MDMIFQEAVVSKMVFLRGKEYWQLPKDLLEGRVTTRQEGVLFLQRVFSLSPSGNFVVGRNHTLGVTLSLGICLVKYSFMRGRDFKRIAVE